MVSPLSLCLLLWCSSCVCMAMPTGGARLPACTIAVAGANGRVGAMVVRELLRTEPAVSVRALVRTTSRLEGYARLSYEVGAEDAQYSLRPAWALADEGGLAWQTEATFDEDVQKVPLYP